MRRRDANDSQTIHRQPAGRWPTGVALLLSFGVHAALLAVAAGLPVQRAMGPTLIRISLLSGGAKGDQDHDGSGAASVGPAEPRPDVAAQNPFDRAQDRRPPSRISKPSQLTAPHKPRKRHAAPVAPWEPSDPVSFVESRYRDGTGDAGAGGQPASNGSGSGGGFGSAAGDLPDPRAYCAYCPEPRYPLIARARGWEGTVEIALSVRGDGSVDAAMLRRSSGYSVLDKAAIAVARESRFHLPRNGGMPAPLRGRIEYRFVLRSQ